MQLVALSKEFLVLSKRFENVGEGNCPVVPLVPALWRSKYNASC